MRATFAVTPALARPETAQAPPRVPLTPAGRRPRVCFLAPTTWPMLSRSRIPVMGGAELQQTMVATTLARRGYDVSMVSHDYGQEDGAEVDGVRVHKMCSPSAGIKVIRFVYPRFTSLWQALKRADADVYYQRCAGVSTGFLAAFCKTHGRRSIYAGASDVDFEPGRTEIPFVRDRLIYEYGLRNVDAIFAQNEYQVESARRNYGREAVLVPNCYDLCAGKRADPRGYVLWVANVRKVKRPELLLEIARRMPDVRFVMAGGSDRDRRSLQYAEGMREALAALPNVTVNGFVPFEEAERLFDGARVVLNTSKYEGFPNTFLQAWARGAPTVAFVDTGSRHEGQPVYDVVPDVEAACARLGALMTNDLEWERASRRVSEHFRSRHALETVATLYEQEINRLVRSA